MEIKNLVQTCSACPSQWEGKTTDNRAVYVRYRWGYLSISVSDPGGSIDDAVCGQEIYGEQRGDEYHGVMGDNELLPILESLPECAS